MDHLFRLEGWMPQDYMLNTNTLMIVQFTPWLPSRWHIAVSRPSHPHSTFMCIYYTDFITIKTTYSVGNHGYWDTNTPDSMSRALHVDWIHLTRSPLFQAHISKEYYSYIPLPRVTYSRSLIYPQVVSTAVEWHIPSPPLSHSSLGR